MQPLWTRIGIYCHLFILLLLLLLMLLLLLNGPYSAKMIHLCLPLPSSRETVPLMVEYLEATELASLIEGKAKELLIVDVREADYTVSQIQYKVK